MQGRGRRASRGGKQRQTDKKKGVKRGRENEGKRKGTWSREVMRTEGGGIWWEWNENEANV